MINGLDLDTMIVPGKNLGNSHETPQVTPLSSGMSHLCLITGGYLYLSHPQSIYPWGIRWSIWMTTLSQARKSLGGDNWNPTRRHSVGRILRQLCASEFQNGSFIEITWNYNRSWVCKISIPQFNWMFSRKPYVVGERLLTCSSWREVGKFVVQNLLLPRCTSGHASKHGYHGEPTGCWFPTFLL